MRPSPTDERTRSPRPSAADGPPESTYALAVPTRRFDYRLGPRSRPLLRLFGVSGPETAWVDLGDDTLSARFGFAKATTPLANIASWRIEGPWKWITAIGI